MNGINKMNKSQLLDAIEKTEMVVDFDRKYLMKKDRAYLEWLYNHCMKCVNFKKENSLEL